MNIILILLFLLLPFSAFSDGTTGLNYVTLTGGGPTPVMTESGRTVLSQGNVSQINFNWGSGNVMNGNRGDGVIVHFTGYIKWPGTQNGQSKTINFYSASDDGFYMKINNSTIINSWREQGMSYYNGAGSVTLTVGQVYAIDMWYYENGGGAGVQLYWNTGTGIELVPTNAFATTSTYWTPSLCCGGSSTPFSAPIENVNKVNSFVNRNTNDTQVYITQIGNNNSFLVDQSGTKNNYTYYSGNGNNNSFSSTQSGNMNTQTNYSHTEVNGNYNSINIIQSSTGGGKGSFINAQNNNNNVSVSQTGSGSHYVDIGVSGGDKSVTVQQTGNVGHMASVQLNGTTSSLILQQTGNSQNFYSIQHTCVLAGGCDPITVTQGN